MADHAWKTDAVLETNTDLNTITDAGIYRGGAAATYTNLPDEAAGAGWLLFVIRQIVHGIFVSEIDADL